MMNYIKEQKIKNDMEAKVLEKSLRPVKHVYSGVVFYHLFSYSQEPRRFQSPIALVDLAIRSFLWFSSKFA